MEGTRRRQWALLALATALLPAVVTLLDGAQVEQAPYWQARVSGSSDWVHLPLRTRQPGVDWQALAARGPGCFPSTVDVEQTASGGLTVDASLQLPSTHPLVGAVLEGRARGDPSAFASQVLAYVGVGPPSADLGAGSQPAYLSWSAPTVDLLTQPQRSATSTKPCTVSGGATIRLHAAAQGLATAALGVQVDQAWQWCVDACFATRVDLTVGARSRTVEAVRPLLTGGARPAVVSGTAHIVRLVLGPRTVDAAPPGVEVVLSPEPGAPSVGQTTRYHVRTGWLEGAGWPWPQLPELWYAVLWALPLLLAVSLLGRGRAAPAAAAPAADVRVVASRLRSLIAVLAGLSLFLGATSAVTEVENAAVVRFDIYPSPAVSGSLVILLAGMMTLWPAIVRSGVTRTEGAPAAQGSGPRPARRWARRAVQPVVWTLGLSGLAAGTVVLVGWLVRTPASAPEPVPGSPTAVLAWTGGAFAATLAMSLALLCGNGRRALPVRMSVLTAVLATLLATVAPLSADYAGRVPDVLHALPVLAAVVALLGFAVLLVARAGAAGSPSVVSRLRHVRGPAGLAVLGAGVAALAWGWKVDPGAGSQPSWYDFYSFSLALRTLCVPAALLVVVRELDARGSADLARGRRDLATGGAGLLLARLRWRRRSALAVAVLALAPSPLQRAGPVPAAFLVFTAAMALGVLPTAKPARLVASHDGYQSPAQQDARVTQFVTSLDARAQPPATGRPSTPSQRAAARRAFDAAASAALRAPAPAVALARDGALAGLVLGAPWLALGTSRLPHPSLSGDPGQVLSLCVAWGLAVLHWPLVGFVFGYAFAFVRGSTGLVKGVTFLAGLATAPAVELVTGALSPSAAAVVLAQQAAVCLPLGLAADWRTLRAAGYGWAEVQSLYRLRFLAGWGAALTAAVASALAVGATASLTELAHLLVTPTTAVPPGPIPSPSTTTTPR